jgi:gliding motility-associated-like protein
MRQLTLSLLLILASYSSFSQVYGTEGYLIGTAVEVGISGLGGYEGSDINAGQPAAPPIHFRSNSGNLFGFVADPTFSGWVNFDGDFFTPGSPENGWGLEIGGSLGAAKFANNCSGGMAGVPGSLGNYQNNAGCMSIDWNGGIASSGVDISVGIVYSLKQNDLYYTTDVTITNNGATSIDSLFYYRNVDPDNNVELSGDYATDNTIIANPPSTCNKAHVTAEQSLPGASYMGFAAIGDMFRVCYGGFSNRDGSSLWFGSTVVPFTLAVGSTNTADEAISLAYLIETIPPGGSETFKFVVILNAAGADAAFDNLFTFDYVGSIGGTAQCIPTIDTVYIVPGGSGATGSACSDSILLEITGSAANDFNWTWSPATGLSATTGPLVWAFPAATTTYTVTGTSISGCFLTPVTKEIVVITAPVADPTLTPAGPFCPGDPAVNIIAADPGGLYSATCGTCIDGVTGLFDPAALATGTYTIYYMFGVGTGCIVQDSIDIIIGGTNPPIVDPAGPYCDGPASYLMSANTPGGVWSGACGACIDAAGNFDPSVSGLGSFDIYYNIGGACGGNDTITIDVVNNLDATITTVPAPICDQSPTQAMTAAMAGGVWSATCPTCIDAVTGDFDPATGAGTYTIYYTFPGACFAIDSTVLTVVTGPDPTITPAGPFCESSGIQTLVPLTAGGAWTASCPTCINATGDFDPLLAGPGNHVITYTLVGTCTAIGTETIYVDSVLVDAVASTDPLCFGSCDGTVTVATTNATQVSVDGGLSFQPTGTFLAQCGGAYSIIAESVNGCQATGSVVLTDPAALTLSVSTIDAVCAGNCDGSVSTIVNGGTALGGYNYGWSGLIAGTTDPVANGVCAGTYDLTITDDNGCIIDSIAFIVGELTPLDPGTNVLIDENCYQSCDGSIEITGTTGTLFSILGPGGAQNNATGLFTNLCAGTYDITIQDVNGCIAVSSSDLFTPAQIIPDFTFGPQPTSFMESEITFTNQSQNATLYSWTFTSGVGTPTSLSTDPVITFPNTVPGTYQACLTASNANGCDTTVCKTVIIDPEFIIYAPNAFTPDGDGINDTWLPVIQGAEADSYEVFIFNRWGELIWSSETLNQSWDGMTKGSSNNMAEQGVYAWRIIAKDIMLNEKHEFKGHVTLLK